MRTLGWSAAWAILLSPAWASAGFWDSYTRFWDEKIEQVIDLDLYGASAQLPEGIFSFKVDWNDRVAAGRYGNHREKQPIVLPINFNGPDGSPMLALDLGASGRGGGITLQFSYGITDMLNFYIEVPLIYMDVQMRPKLRHLSPDAQMVINGFLPADYPHIQSEWFDSSGRTTDRYLNEASEWLLNYLPRLGRPALISGGDYPPELGPGKAYHSGGAVLADMNLGFSWNFYRSSRWSGAFTPRVFLPTGNLADPNSSLTLGTGPELDRGVGSFGVSFTQDYDLRLFKYKHWVDVVVTGEFTYTYRFAGKRRYPDFPKPTPDGERLLDLLDPERQYFPDMSDLTGKTYKVIPGSSVQVMGSLSVSVLFFAFSASIGYGYNQEPEFHADRRFETMVRSLEMALAGHMELMKLTAGVNLLPFYIPLQITYQYERSIGGRNSIFFTDDHWLTIKGFLPTRF